MKTLRRNQEVPSRGWRTPCPGEPQAEGQRHRRRTRTTTQTRLDDDHKAYATTKTKTLGSELDLPRRLVRRTHTRRGHRTKTTTSSRPPPVIFSTSRSRGCVEKGGKQEADLKCKNSASQTEFRTTSRISSRLTRCDPIKSRLTRCKTE
jgi:hypothetical protein